MSPTIGAIMSALAITQATIGGAVKGKVNPAFKSKYADLASVWEAWQEAGPPNDLAVTQWNGAVIDGRVEITTMLGHKSGEWIRETALIPVSKADAQGYVSAVTYGRRCALSALAGIAPEDDDGNAAVAGRGAPVNAAQLAELQAIAGEGRGAPLRVVEATGPISAGQLEVLQEIAGEVGADLGKFCKYFKVDSLADIPAARFGDAGAALNAKRKAHA